MLVLTKNGEIKEEILLKQKENESDEDFIKRANEYYKNLINVCKLNNINIDFYDINRTIIGPNWYIYSFPIKILLMNIIKILK